MLRISEKLFQTVKLSRTPAYRIAISANIHPNTLSKILHGAVPIKKRDPRVLRLGKVLGIPTKDLFEEGGIEYADHE